MYSLYCLPSFYLHLLIPTPTEDQNPKPLLIETQRCYKLRLLFLPPSLPLVLARSCTLFLQFCRVYLSFLAAVPHSAAFPFVIRSECRRVFRHFVGNEILLLFISRSNETRGGMGRLRRRKQQSEGRCCTCALYPLCVHIFARS